MKKIFCIFLCVFFLSGCVSKYELVIDGDTFSETITAYIYSDDRENDLYDGIESGDRIDAMINYDVYSLFGTYSSKYSKDYKKTKEYEKVVLKQKYNYSDFKKSNSIMSCFHKYDLNRDDKNYSIKLYDGFFCLYNNQKLDIIIKFKNKVYKSNADEIKGNKHIWHVNQDNYSDLKIDIKFSRQSNVKKYTSIAIVSIVIVLILVSSLITIKKIRKNSKV